jgi:hypothetical protein
MTLLTGELNTPIVDGTIEIDLGTHTQTFGVTLDQPAELQFPLNAYDGAIARVGFRITGNYALTVDTDVFAVENQPDWPNTPGAFVDTEIRVKTVQPPVAFFRVLSVGSTNLSSTRRFSIVPAIAGRTIWDLDFHGPIDLHGPGSWTIKPLGERLDCVVRGWGPGGSTGAAGYSGNSPTSGGMGSATTFDGMIANPGAPSLAAIYSTNQQTIGTSGGAGGTASGGDTNINGTNGTNGSSTGSPGSGNYNPKGGDASASSAPDGAALQSGLQASTAGDPDTNNSDALPGLERGGGATGAAARTGDKLTWAATGGGGTGGYFAKTYDANTTLTIAKTLVIGDSGAPGTANFSSFGAAQGAKGDTGWARIS